MQAVAALAGVATSVPTPDYGADLSLREVEQHFLVGQLLRELTPIRCLLVVLVLPDEEALWLSQSTEELLVRRCACWYSLRGAESTTGTSSVRIAIPPSQVFSVSAIHAILNRLRQGQEP